MRSPWPSRLYHAAHHLQAGRGSVARLLMTAPAPRRAARARVTTPPRRGHSWRPAAAARHQRRHGRLAGHDGPARCSAGLLHPVLLRAVDLHQARCGPSCRPPSGHQAAAGQLATLALPAGGPAECPHSPTTTCNLRAVTDPAWGAISGHRHVEAVARRLRQAAAEAAGATLETPIADKNTPTAGGEGTPTSRRLFDRITLDLRHFEVRECARAVRGRGGEYVVGVGGWVGHRGGLRGPACRPACPRS